jgi:hypothetical protein
MMRALIVVMLCACGTPRPVEYARPRLLTRAGFDFNCAEQQLQIRELSSNTAGVEGCGKRATYVYQTSTVSEGVWVMNTATGAPEGSDSNRNGANP